MRERFFRSFYIKMNRAGIHPYSVALLHTSIRLRIRRLF